MKKLLLLSIICITVLSSCDGNQTPIVDGKVPFIVDKIDKYNETHSIYYGRKSDHSSTNHLFGGLQGAIILPTGYYNINDTISYTKLFNQSLCH